MCKFGQKTGSLLVRLPAQSAVRGLREQIASYDLQLLAQNQTLTASGKPDEIVRFESVPAGEWSLVVNGLNADGRTIAVGEASGELAPGEVKSVVVVMEATTDSGKIGVEIGFADEVPLPNPTDYALRVILDNAQVADNDPNVSYYTVVINDGADPTGPPRTIRSVKPWQDQGFTVVPAMINGRDNSVQITVWAEDGDHESLYGTTVVETYWGGEHFREAHVRLYPPQ